MQMHNGEMRRFVTAGAAHTDVHTAAEPEASVSASTEHHTHESHDKVDAGPKEGETAQIHVDTEANKAEIVVPHVEAHTDAHSHDHAAHSQDSGNKQEEHHAEQQHAHVDTEEVEKSQTISDSVKAALLAAAADDSDSDAAEEDAPKHEESPAEAETKHEAVVAHEEEKKEEIVVEAKEEPEEPVKTHSRKSSSSSSSSEEEKPAPSHSNHVEAHQVSSTSHAHDHAHDHKSSAETHAPKHEEHEKKPAPRPTRTSDEPEEKETSRTSRASAASTRSKSERKPISRVSSSSSSASSVEFEEIKREPGSSHSHSDLPPRSSYKPLEPFVYNTSTSDDENDEETKKAVSRAVERRGNAKSRAATERVEQDLLDAQETILSLKRRLAKSESETEEARDASTGTQESLDTAKLELDLLRKKYGDMVNFREESESDAKKWRQRAEILQGELELGKFTERKLAETAKALVEAREALEEEKAKNETLAAQLKSHGHDSEEVSRAHARELASARRAQEVTVAASEAQIKAEREKASEAIQFVKSKLKAQIKELEILLEDRREDDGEARSDKRRLEREVRRLEEKLEGESSERAKEQRSAESNKRQTELLKDRVNKLTADKLDLETLVLQEKRKFDALNADYDRAAVTIRNLQAQLEDSKASAAGQDDSTSKRQRHARGNSAAATTSSEVPSSV